VAWHDLVEKSQRVAEQKKKKGLLDPLNFYSMGYELSKYDMMYYSQ